MKTCIKTIAAIIFLAVASTAVASQQYSIGYASGTNNSIEVDISSFSGYGYGSVAIYQDGNIVFQCDTGGVLYAATGVSWSQSGSMFTISGLPEGNYTGDLTMQGASYEFSDGQQYVEIRGFTNYDEVWVDFFLW